MTKSLVEPKGSFEYRCPTSGQHVNSHRPTVIEPTDYLNGLLAGGKLTLVKGGEDLPEKLTDDEWKKVWVKNGKDVSKSLAEIKPSKKPEPTEAEKKAAA